MDAVLHRSRAALPTHDRVGATRPALLDGAALPAGFGHLRFRRRVGRGEAAFTAAAQCVLGWQMHRGAGLAVRADGPRAVQGVTVVVAIGVGPARLHAPCRVVWAVDEPHRQGFGYTTLPGHPEIGEEAFVVLRDAADEVWLCIAAFARPGRWYTRLGSPGLPVAQRVAVRAYAAAVTRAVTRAPAGPPR